MYAFPRVTLPQRAIDEAKVTVCCFEAALNIALVKSIAIKRITDDGTKDFEKIAHRGYSSKETLAGQPQLQKISIMKT